MDKLIIQERLKYAYCITKLEDVCDLAYFQNSDGFTKEYNEIVNLAWQLGNDEIRANIKRISSSQDIIFLADQIKTVIIPKLKMILNQNPFEDIAVGDQYKIVSTESGYFTLYNTVYNRYIHSRISPMNIARNNIKSVYDPMNSHYFFWGVGLGYELLSLYEISNGSITIDAYENDPIVFECAKKYGVLDKIPEGIVTYHIGEGVEDFVAKSRNRYKGIYINLPSFYVINNPEERAQIVNILINQSTFIRLENQFKINIRHNIDMKIPDAHNLVLNKSSREIVIVAGGPSFNDSLSFLKESCHSKCIFAVGTIYEKLLNNGIVPDAVFVNDPKERTLTQFENIWSAEAPLIIDAVAHWKFATNYEGPKYLAWTILAESFYLKATDYSKNKKYPSSSTVTSFAIDYAISLCPEIIYFVGLDLAFPNGESHASGTMDYHKVNTAGLYEVESNSGGTVLTNDLFTSYRLEIECKISVNNNILFINKSNIGAKIHGAE